MRSPLRTLAPAPAAAFLLTLLFTFVPGCTSTGRQEDHGQEEAAPGQAALPDDPASQIVHWQSERDEGARDSVMSPFSAVAAHYIDEGATARIGADQDRTALASSNDPMEAVAAITYRDESFWVEPVKGSEPPFIHLADDDGEPEAGGTEVEESHRVADEEIVSVGRYYLSMSPQSGFGRIMVYDPDAPMRKEFDGFLWFPPDPMMKVAATWVPASDPEELTIGTSRGLEKSFYRAGWFEFTVDGSVQRLAGLAESPDPEPGTRLFCPFQDATTGKETYEIGRYISITFNGAGEEHWIDFNHATNPFCNYSPHYNCPLPPKENRLTVAIRAGEMAYPIHGS